MNKLKNRLKIILPITIALIVIFGPIIVNNKGLLVFYGDSVSQMVHFYIGGWEKVHSGTLGLWNFSNSYGASSFCDVYYFLTSPFFWISCLFPKAWIPQLFLYLNMLKIFLAYVTSFLWLRNIFRKDHIAIIGALAASFSGWVCFLYNYNFFLDTYFIYFILLYFIDKSFFDNRKFKYISLNVMILCIINYYNAYMFLPFAVIYATFRWIIIHSFSIKEMALYVMKVIGYILIGVGLSAFILLPCAQIIIKTPRFSEGTIELFHPLSWKVLYRWITSLLSPVVHHYDANLFIHYESGNGLGWSGGCSLYSSIFMVLLMLLIPFIKDKKKRNTLLGTILLFGVMLIFPFFYKILQGTIETRWFYMIVLFNIYAGMSVLEEIEEGNIDKKWLLASFTLVLSAVIFCIVFSRIKYLSNGSRYLVKIMSIICILLFMYCLTLFFNKKRALILVAIIEAIIPMSLMFKNGDYLSMSDLQVEISTPTYLYEYIGNFDSGFYRYGFSNRMSSFSENYPIMNNVRGTTSYTSVYNYNQEDFLSRFKFGWKINLNVGRFKTNNICSLKYWITDKESDFAPFGYEEMEPLGDYRIFLNKYFVNLGYSSTDTINEKTFKKLTYLNQDRLYPFYIVTDDSSNMDFEYKDSLFELADEWGGHIEIDWENSFEGTNIYLENYDFGEVYINLYLNEEQVLSQRIVQYNYIDFYYPKEIEFNKIVIDISNATDANVNFKVYGENNFDYYKKWYESLNTFYDVQYSTDKIVAKINIEEPSIVATSVPYDEGWQVWVDGKKIETKKVNLGFVGFEINEGNHEVELKYWPSILNIGIIISILSGLFLVYLVYKRKPQ